MGNGNKSHLKVSKKKLECLENWSKYLCSQSCTYFFPGFFISVYFISSKPHHEYDKLICFARAEHSISQNKKKVVGNNKSNSHQIV